MIYITGDCHRNFERFNTRNFPEQKEMAKEDYVIICGDFGGIWDQKGESKEETMLMDWLDCKSYTTLFVDGNHENFDRLYEYPVEEWHGGKVHKIRPFVIHLMRGQVFEIEGKSIFTFGGASSHDIDGGILEPDDPDYKYKKRRLDRGWQPYRINHVSWWQQELPSAEEMEEGRKNLAAHGNSVDFIVTHCCASNTQILLGGSEYKPDVLTAYLEEIQQNTKFKKWFFGHYHDNQNVNAEEILRLLYKSNPTLFEWFSSPIVYMETEFADELRKIMMEYFSTKKSLYHYISMAEGNYREYLKSEMVKAKKYFYVLRPVLACGWILDKGTSPPMKFSELMQSELPDDFREDVERLLDLKMKCPEVKKSHV